MLDFVRTLDVLPVVSLFPLAGSLDFSCLDGRVTSHPKFASSYEWAYDDYFRVEDACPGDIVCGVPVTVVSVVGSINRSLLESTYHEESDFFFVVGAGAGFLEALAQDHWKEAQAGLVVLAALACVMLSEVLPC